jgi:hypothetical protein
MREHAAGETDRVWLVGEFADPKLEAAYRQRYAPQDRLFGRVIVAMAAVTVLALGLMDRSQIADDTAFVWMQGVRVTFFALSAVALVLLRGQPSPAAFVRVLFGWYLLTVGVQLYGGCAWPAGQTDMRLAASMAVLASYTVMPLPMRYQAVGALLHAAASLLLIAWLNPPSDQTALLSDVIWLSLLNGLGLFMSYRLHTRQRRLFAAAVRQTELSSNLARALAEVRTLRGLIRVCSWCRKVDADGVWRQLEAYVKDHSHAEFTHGICPTCLEVAVGEVNETRV